MVNESLEVMIKNAKVTPEIADSLRSRLSFLSPASQSDFNFVLNRINNKTDIEDSEPQVPKKTPYAKIRDTKIECLKFEKLNMIRYGKALNYVIKKALDLDATIVVANADCREGKTDFFYKPSDLDYAIRHVRKYNR